MKAKVLLQTSTGRLVPRTLTSTVPFDATLSKVVLDRVGRVSPSLDTAAARKLDFFGNWYGSAGTKLLTSISDSSQQASILETTLIIQQDILRLL